MDASLKASTGYSQNDRAEPKLGFTSAQELGSAHYLASEDTIHIHSRYFHLGIILEQFFEILDGFRGVLGWRGCHLQGEGVY